MYYPVRIADGACRAAVASGPWSAAFLSSSRYWSVAPRVWDSVRHIPQRCACIARVCPRHLADADASPWAVPSGVGVAFLEDAGSMLGGFQLELKKTKQNEKERRRTDARSFRPNIYFWCIINILGSSTAQGCPFRCKYPSNTANNSARLKATTPFSRGCAQNIINASKTVREKLTLQYYRV